MTCAARRLERPNGRKTERNGLAAVAAVQKGKSQRPGTTIADIVSLDRKKSLTGLYELEGNATVRPLNGHGTNKKLLARTKGLTEEQKSDLAEQNVKVVYVREGGISDIGVVTSEEQSRIPDELFNTVVVPYVALNDAQAESVLNMASQLPVPVEKKRPSVNSALGLATIATFAGLAGM